MLLVGVVASLLVLPEAMKRLLVAHNMQNRNILSSKTMTTQETLETIAAMRSQECSVYTKRNWLDLEQNERPMSIPSKGRLLSEARVDVVCRNEMSAWYLRLADACDFSSETAEIAMSLLDRFLTTPEGTEARSDRGVYQLASMAALYTAVKVHETTAIDSTTICSLSCGVYFRKDLEAMEIKILHALKWRVNPPTSFSFVRKLMELIPEEVLEKEKFQTVLDLAQLQVELAIIDYTFVTVKASTVAYSALMNSLENLGLEDGVLDHLSNTLAEALQINCISAQVTIPKNVLNRLLVRQRQANVWSRGLKDNDSRKRSSSRYIVGVSPRSVKHL
jgi:hypothetical protein